MVNEALVKVASLFARMYTADFQGGRPSIGPWKVLCALLLPVFYSVRSERQLMEQTRYNLLYEQDKALGRARQLAWVHDKPVVVARLLMDLGDDLTAEATLVAAPDRIAGGNYSELSPFGRRAGK